MLLRGDLRQANADWAACVSAYEKSLCLRVLRGRVRSVPLEQDTAALLGAHTVRLLTSLLADPGMARFVRWRSTSHRRRQDHADEDEKEDETDADDEDADEDGPSLVRVQLLEATGCPLAGPLVPRATRWQLPPAIARLTAQVPTHTAQTARLVRPVLGFFLVWFPLLCVCVSCLP